MADLNDAYAVALFQIAKAEGSLERVEDELFRFARTLEGNDELRMTLTDFTIPVERRQTLLAEALSRATGKRVSIKEVVDPSVLGGVVAIIGDTVIDASIRHRLEQLREAL